MHRNVMVLETDPSLAFLLAGALRPQFSVQVTHSRDELRENLTRSQPEAVVVNIEEWRLADVEKLHSQFPSLPIVCTHRVPDEEMWMAALEAGASDVCPVDDVAIVLTSVLRSVQGGAAA